MKWVANEKDAFDGIKGCVRQTCKGIDSCCGTLRIAFENKAFVSVGGETGMNLVKNLESG